MALFAVLPPATFAVLWLIERRWAARRFPEVEHWTLIGLGFFMVTGIISTVMPFALEPLRALRVLDLGTLALPAQILVGWALLSLAVFAWHVVRHKTSPLWRYFHQLHHSPRRLDVAVSVYFHPLESCTFPLIAVAVCSVLLGLSPLAAAAVGYIQCFHGMFQHWNVATPRWLGYLIQRPESHCLHHAMGREGCNYSDFPLWDMLYGTFRNPAEFHGRVGFAEHVAMDWASMVRGIDVSGNLPRFARATSPARPRSAPRPWAGSSPATDHPAPPPPY